ncbi:zinc finger RNA binding protein 2 [Phyllostomus discolor]|uniref:Zinc finger RNA binding protein 2 n=1 Tax=Phyllostomus discolor TaxID=89673 RepID=A0A833ZQG0_9CHIR|nr:zinc finger RNA binding protein 2 [Phyllostomus discolor]
MAAGGSYGFAQGAGPQYSAQPPPAFPLPASGASFAAHPTPGMDPAGTLPFASEATWPPRSGSPAGYGGYQPHAIQDFDYSSRLLEPTPTPTAASSYQDSYGYEPLTAISSSENKQHHPPAVGQSQLPARAVLCQPEAKGAYCQPSGGCSQAQPLQQALTTKAAQPASVLSSSYTYSPASSVQQPSVFMSTLPSCTSSSSYSFASTPYTGPSYPSCYMSVYPAAGPYYPPLLPPQMQPLPPPPPKPEDLSPWGASGNSSSARSAGSFTKKALVPTGLPKPKDGPRQPPLHYCDLCKISCAGAQVSTPHAMPGRLRRLPAPPLCPVAYQRSGSWPAQKKSVIKFAVSSVGQNYPVDCPVGG